MKCKYFIYKWHIENNQKLYFVDKMKKIHIGRAKKAITIIIQSQFM